MRNKGSMLCVATVSDVRRDNARRLAKQAGGLSAFAKKIERGDPYVSQLIGKNPQRGIGHAMARYIEECFGLEPGWLDAQHDDEEPLSDSTVAFARWYQKLAPDEREKLRGIAALALGKAVPDEVVEQRMPVTKPINAPRD